ncbi:MAG: VOC family protein [Blautia sp.]|nr:VOC family protein [Blautia sp.]
MNEQSKEKKIMKMTGLNHFTINVVDLEKSKEFYENVLGLQSCGFVDMGDHRLTYYQLPQNVKLELIQYDDPDIPVPFKPTHVGMYRHFCLETDSLDEVMENCRKYGVTVLQEPAYVEKLEFRNILILDPNGVEIEIIEI